MAILLEHLHILDIFAMSKVKLLLIVIIPLQ